MNRPERPDQLMAIPDVQSESDARALAIDQVGIRGLRYPLSFADHDGVAQGTIATANVYVALPEERKGTNMSRLVMLLEERAVPGAPPLSVAALRGLIDDLVARLDAPGGRIELAFPFFVRKVAPVSGIASLLDYEVRLAAELSDGRYDRTVAVAAPVTSLCPCSKEISDYGAHNQRSHVTIKAKLRSHIWIEELIDLVESEASSELYGILKRVDEKYVTERAYDNPKFVEDMVRDVAGRLNAEDRIAAYVVEAENFESIHNHSAYALIERDKEAAAS